MTGVTVHAPCMTRPCQYGSAGDCRAGSACPLAQVKSYLTGNPAINLALNDNLAIGRREGPGGTSGPPSSSEVVMLDDCNFHESVSLDRFETERALTLVPPDGEFAVMNYRCVSMPLCDAVGLGQSACAPASSPAHACSRRARLTGRSTYNFKPPFKVYTIVEDDPHSATKVGFLHAAEWHPQAGWLAGALAHAFSLLQAHSFTAVRSHPCQESYMEGTNAPCGIKMAAEAWTCC